MFCPQATEIAKAEGLLKKDKKADRGKSKDELKEEEEAVTPELDAAVDVPHMENTLMEQGVAKFVAPQKQLLQTIREKRASLASR